MILVTGAAGFIGSNIVSSLNKKGIQNIIICDWLNDKSKNKNINKLIYQNIVSPEDIFKYLDKNNNIELVIHMGAKGKIGLYDYQMKLSRKVNVNDFIKYKAIIGRPITRNLSLNLFLINRKDASSLGFDVYYTF